VIVLAIDTATRRVGVALGTADGVLASVELGGAAADGPPRHAEQLAPAIEFVCEQAQIPLAAIDVIGVGIGPGMFTGLRVGVTTAKALGFALDRPLVAVPSLDLVAFPLRHADHRLIVPLIDARRNEVYYALYRPVPGGVQRVSEYLLASPEDVATELEAIGDDAVLCGDGAVRFRAVFDDLDRCTLAGPGHSTPDLSALVELTVGRHAHGKAEPAGAVTPMYLRRSDAEIDRERRLAAGGA
jgi:tRNA threonylcarbamoyladenosine biosynthesis protein TsaB